MALILLIEINYEERMLEADEEVSFIARCFLLFVLLGTLLDYRLLFVLDRLYRPVAAFMAAIDLLLQLLLRVAAGDIFDMQVCA